mmetsp:Transcript_19901/g.47363  ORF Transcript_19901/g.47363 Transcript_19901/m.47363 type:complete len:215 (-) Transcript_19901:2234-2878(-)
MEQPVLVALPDNLPRFVQPSTRRERGSIAHSAARTALAAAQAVAVHREIESRVARARGVAALSTEPASGRASGTQRAARERLRAGRCEEGVCGARCARALLARVLVGSRRAERARHARRRGALFAEPARNALLERGIEAGAGAAARGGLDAVACWAAVQPHGAVLHGPVRAGDPRLDMLVPEAPQPARARHTHTAVVRVQDIRVRVARHAGPRV